MQRDGEGKKRAEESWLEIALNSDSVTQRMRMGSNGANGSRMVVAHGVGPRHNMPNYQGKSSKSTFIGA